MSDLAFNKTWEEWTQSFFTPRPSAAITGREKEILYHTARGFGLKSVAHTLGISEQTVKNHLTNIREKLNVQTTMAAVWILRHELDDAPEEMWMGWGI